LYVYMATVASGFFDLWVGIQNMEPQSLESSFNTRRFIQ
jgi:hypothetical protein